MNNENNTYKKIYLKKDQEKRILRGEPWIYKDEIQGGAGNFTPGDPVKIYSWKKEYIATGYVNTATTIAVRVLTRDEKQTLNEAFFKQRIQAADNLRKELNPENLYYRMVYGEADQLPGLVIDRYDDYFVIQVTTAGMEHFKQNIFSIISQFYPNGVIIEKSIGASRQKENLESLNCLITPDRSPEKIIAINGLKFKLNFLKSQKTGFFLDQRENYLLLKNISRGKEVLDVFSYAGAWGLHAHLFGARTVQFLEVSRQYLDQTQENITFNGFKSDDFILTHGDAVPILKEMSRENLAKDIIILDPPAFIKSRSKIKEGLRGYKEINLRALKMIKPGGFLITCSCSHFFSREDFLDVIDKAAFDAQKRVKLLAYKTQPYDHPILLPLYQSEYLKCALLSVD
ncbi:MAG TPA: class I SAM-dependent rRNA methyltransferase [Candidatus Kapabacteria bacterium]|nr:class I SAM-dependent rRNA methyltransferase [Candidatus Kapabacteria bacterium]